MGQSLAVGGHRLGVGVPPGGAVGEAREVLDGLGRGGRACVVIGEAIVDVLEAAGVERLQRGSHAGVQALASRGEEAAVGDLLDEGMLEDVDRLAARRLLVQELQPLQLGQRTLEHVGPLPERGEQPMGNQPPDHGGLLDETLGLGGQPVDARHQHLLDGAGQLASRPSWRCSTT